MSLVIREKRKSATGRALSLVGEILHVELDQPYAPGSPAELLLETVEPLIPEPIELRGKTVFVRKQPNGLFALRFRLLSLRKEHRALLKEQLSEGSP